MTDETKTHRGQTDALQLREWAAAAEPGRPDRHQFLGKVRREFLEIVVARLATRISLGLCHEEEALVWDFAERLLAEGQRRGHLP
jgi:hypothetical protein